MYSCSVLAIDAQGRQIQTLEGLSQNGKPHPVSKLSSRMTRNSVDTALPDL